MSASNQAAARSLRVPANDIDLAVAAYDGPEPSIILLHGIGSRGVSFLPVLDALAARHRLIVPDLRGHGASTKPTAGYLLTDYAADLAGLIDALQIERPILLGHSLGGMVSVTWASHNPDRAAAIVLEETALRSAPDVGNLFAGWIELAGLGVDGAAAYYRQRHPTWSDADCRRRAESITATNPAVFTELRDHYLREPGADRIAPLAAIRSPTLLVHGDLAAGGMVVQTDADRLAALLPNARAVRIPGGGHSLHRDHTAAFLDSVLPYLEDVAQAR